MPFLHLLDRASIFRVRAGRLRALAEGHAMGDYLRFIARIADAQQRLLDSMPPVALPSPETLATCIEHGMPPVNVQTHLRDPLWRDGVRHIARELAESSEGLQREVAVRVEGARDDFYEAQASKLTAGITMGLDVAAAPIIAAGLQVYFTHLVLSIGALSIGRSDAATLCPCCASRPTASVIRIGGSSAGYRFLHCSLCSAQWHYVRVKCAHCESTKGIAYLSLEGPDGIRSKAVNVETCDECGEYLKQCSMERDPHVEPVADDLATLALDLLVSDTGKVSCGVNYMLVHGDPDA